MKITELRLTADAAIRAAEIDDAIEKHIYESGKWGQSPALDGYSRGAALRKYCRDETLDALYAEYDALPREEVVTGEISEYETKYAELCAKYGTDESDWPAWEFDALMRLY